MRKVIPVVQLVKYELNPSVYRGDPGKVLAQQAHRTAYPRHLWCKPKALSERWK